jgi:hypothetical protein
MRIVHVISWLPLVWMIFLISLCPLSFSLSLSLSLPCSWTVESARSEQDAVLEQFTAISNRSSLSNINLVFNGPFSNIVISDSSCLAPLRSGHCAGVPTSETASSPRRGVRRGWWALLTIVSRFLDDFPACTAHFFEQHILSTLCHVPSAGCHSQENYAICFASRIPERRANCKFDECPEKASRKA